MQTATQDRQALKPLRSIRIRRKGSGTQRRPGKRHKTTYKHRISQQPRIVRPICQSRDTRVFNPASLTFNIKLGSQILAKRGVSTDFAFENKRTVLLLYNTLKHMPEYEDKQFATLNEAIYHVFDQLTKITAGKPWYFKEIDDWGYDEKIPEQYTLVIVNEDHDANGRAVWSSMKGMFGNVRNDPKRRRILLMCMKHLVTGIGFSIFDHEGSEGIPSIQDWYTMELDNALSELEYAIKQKDPVKKDIKDAEKNIVNIKSTYIDYDRHCGKIVKKIYGTKIDNKWLRRALKSLSPSDFKTWAEHVQFLVDRKFNMYNYAPSGHQVKGGNTNIEDEMASSLSAYGFIYDGKDQYSEHINHYWNDYANNVGVIPFMDYTEIHPTEGIIRECTYEPVMAWIQKIFDFNLQTFSYEND